MALRSKGDDELIRVVPLLIPVSENAADTTENAGIGIGEYTSLCTNQMPCNL